MRVVFIGTVEFSLRVIEKLIALNVNLVGVCTKESSSFNSDFADLAPVCSANLIPYLYVNNINSDENIDWIEKLNPDVIFCFGWSSLLKERVLNIPPMGVIGYHPAKLPENRGRHPLIWAIALGLENSASTFFFMDKGADSGDILSQVDFNISYQDDAQSVYQKVINVAVNQIEEFIPKLQSGKYKKIKQSDINSNIWRKRNELDGLIDFRMSSRSIYNLTRALTRPYIGAHINYNKGSFSVWGVKEINNSQQNIEPGKVLESNGKTFVVKTYDGAIEVVNHNFKILPKVGGYL
jgi:methionyl-tRNA formyltransferase